MWVNWSAAQGPEGVRVEGTVALQASSFRRKDVVRIEPIAVAASAVAGRVRCVVEGEAATTVTYACSRCLAPVSTELCAPFREVFSRVPPTSDEEDSEVVFAPGEDVDLTGYVEQAVFLELAHKPLCRPDCRGLCPVCGGNRNLTPCGCGEIPVDPRLAGLAGFFGGSGDG